MSIARLSCIALGLAFLTLTALPAGEVARDGGHVTLDGKPVKLWGVRTASASQSAENTAHLLAQLGDYQSHGLNAVTVFYQGSSGGFSNPFSADGAQIDQAHHARMVEIIEACDRRGMVVIVGIFYQRSDFFRTAAGWENATRAVTRALRPYRNVIINLANEQNSSLYKDSNSTFDIGAPSALIRLCDIVHEEDRYRLVGAGGYDYEKNIALGVSPSVDLLLFDTNGPEDSAALYDRFVAAGVKEKPIINVEQFGAYSAKPDFPKVAGVFTKENKALFLREIAAVHSRPYFHTFFFDARWLQGTGHGHKTNRYDLGGDGTEASPGWRWYAEAIKTSRARP